MTADVWVDPLEVGTVEYDDPCSGCGTPFTSGDVALISSQATYFYCFECVTKAYEAMKAAQ